MADPNELVNQAVAPGATTEPRKEVRRAVLRKIEGRNVPTYVEQVRAPDGSPCLLVIERLARGPTVTDEQAAEYVRDARAASALQHANIVRARAITVRGDEIVVATDFVEGERLSELWRALAAAGSILPADIAVRVLVDVLSGLGALHDFSDPKGPAQKLSHGEVTGANVLVGADGVSRLLHTARIRPTGSPPTGHGGSIAPEVVKGAPPDRRADIFSVGVLLWQTLSGIGALDDDADLVARIRSGKVMRASALKDAPWATPLADVAARAMAIVPDQRYPSATAMSAELLKIIGDKLPDATRVAAFLKAKVPSAPATASESVRAPAAQTASPKTASVLPIVTPEPARPAPTQPSTSAAATTPGSPRRGTPKPFVATAAKGATATLASKAPPATKPAPIEPKPLTPPAAKPVVGPVAPKPPLVAAAAKPVAAPIAPKPPVANPAAKPVAAPTAPKPPVAATPEPVAARIAPKPPALPVVARPPALPAVTKPLGSPMARATAPVEPKSPLGAATGVGAPRLPAKPPALTPKRPTVSQTAKVDAPSARADVLEIDGSEADSVPPSSPPSSPPSEDGFPVVQRVAVTAPTGKMPPVTERPVPNEPKVVIAASGSDDAEDIVIDTDSSPPSSSGEFVRRMEPLPPAPQTGSLGEARPQRFDTPAAAPVMAPAASGEAVLSLDALRHHGAPTDRIPRPRSRRGTLLVLAGSCLILVALAGSRLWRDGQKASGSAPTAANPEVITQGGAGAAAAPTVATTNVPPTGSAPSSVIAAPAVTGALLERSSRPDPSTEGTSETPTNDGVEPSDPGAGESAPAMESPSAPSPPALDPSRTNAPTTPRSRFDPTRI